MPTITDTAICIRRWDFSETSQTVSVFTRSHGIIRGIAKGSKRERGTFSGGLDVLTRGQVVAIVKPGRDLATLTAWNLEATWRVLRQRLDANRAGLYMADIVHHMLTGHDPFPRLFDAMCAALDDLGESAADTRAIGVTLLTFQWRLLEETGYRPEVDRDVETGAPLPGDGDDAPLAFDPRGGGIVVGTGGETAARGAGQDRWRVRRTTVDLVRRIAAGERVERAAPEVVDRANRLLATYLRDLIGEETAAMRWAFSDLAV